MSRFEKERTQLEATNLQRKQEAEAVAKKLDGLSFVILRQAGDTGQLYGSVSTRDIADAVTAGGFTIDRVQVLLDRPIKSLGLARRARGVASRSRDQGRYQCGPHRGRGAASGRRRKREPVGSRRLCRRAGGSCGAGRACRGGPLRWRRGTSRFLEQPASSWTRISCSRLDQLSAFNRFRLRRADLRICARKDPRAFLLPLVAHR